MTQTVEWPTNGLRPLIKLNLEAVEYELPLAVTRLLDTLPPEWRHRPYPLVEVGEDCIRILTNRFIGSLVQLAAIMHLSVGAPLQLHREVIEGLWAERFNPFSKGPLDLLLNDSAQCGRCGILMPLLRLRECPSCHSRDFGPGAFFKRRRALAWLN